MATPGLGLGTPAVNDPQAGFRMRIALAQAKIKRSASWFDWIAIFSVVNSVILLANGNWYFLLGLGVTEVVTAQSGPGQGRIFGLGVTVIAAGFFWGMGYLTKKGQMWALILGMVLYVADGAILVLIPDWFSLAFHGYALFMLSRAFSALKEFEAAKQAAESSGVFLNQPVG